jgi:hypothetical protein
MADYPGEPVTIQVKNPRDALGNRLDDTNSTADTEVYESDATTLLVPRSSMSWRTAAEFDPPLTDEAGRFIFEWDTTGRLAGKYLAKVFVTPQDGIESWEWHEILLVDRPLTGRCGGAWFDYSDVPVLSRLEEDDRKLLAESASRMLFNATAQVFTGLCSDTFRPPSANCAGSSGLMAGSRLADGSLWLGMNGTDMLPEATFGPLGGGDGNTVMSPIMSYSTIVPPLQPIVSVDRVTIDGENVDPSEWLIVEDRAVIRAGGKSWPLWQRLDRPLGQPQTWGIEITGGVAIPPTGVLASRVLAVEFAKAPAWLDDDTCRLPKRLQSINREGMSAVVLDPFTFLQQGGFGIYEVDTFINTENPNHLTRDAKVLNPDLLAGRPLRVR